MRYLLILLLLLTACVKPSVVKYDRTSFADEHYVMSTVKLPVYGPGYFPLFMDAYSERASPFVIVSIYGDGQGGFCTAGLGFSDAKQPIEFEPISPRETLFSNQRADVQYTAKMTREAFLELANSKFGTIRACGSVVRVDHNAGVWMRTLEKASRSTYVTPEEKCYKLVDGEYVKCSDYYQNKAEN